MVRRRATLSFLIPENSSGTGNLIAPLRVGRRRPDWEAIRSGRFALSRSVSVLSQRKSRLSLSRFRRSL